jgi:hypothetical protein
MAIINPPAGARQPTSGMQLDHIMWAAPDLNEGITYIEQLTGIRATPGGRHPGRGTHNALLSLQQNCYLEIIAPDPSQALDNNLGATIKALKSPGIFTYCVQTRDMDALVRAAKQAHIAIRGPDRWTRDQPDGEPLEWLLAFTDETPFGAHVPFYIDWLKSPHPSTTAVSGLTLASFVVTHPDQEGLAALYAALGIDIQVMRGDRPSMRAVLQSPRGEITLTSASQS